MNYLTSATIKSDDGLIKIRLAVHHIPCILILMSSIKASLKEQLSKTSSI